MNEMIQRYIDRLMDESTPDKPLWNIEKIREGKINGWNYIDGCMMIALLNLYDITGQEKYRDFVLNFLDYYVFEDGSIRGFVKEDYNLDNICEGRVLFEAYRLSGKEKFRKGIDTLYDQLKDQPRTHEGSFWHKAIYPNQVWLDGLYMAQVFYTRYETEFHGCEHYSDIQRQFQIVRQRMFDPETGLYRHGYDASKTAFWADENGLSKNCWLRSVGWFSAALVDVISLMDRDSDGFYNNMCDLLRELMPALKGHIDPETGMLYQLPDKVGVEGNYPETSGSAMAAYTMLKGARLGILSPDYAEAGRKLFEGISNRYLTEKDGVLNLGGICLVAGLGPDNNRRRDGTVEYYLSEPIVENDAKGVAPFLMCYTELRQAE